MYTRATGTPLVSPLSNPERLLRRQGIESVLYSYSEGESSEGEERIMENNNMNNPPPTNPFDVPMINRTKTVPRTQGSAIRTPRLGDDFSVKGHHLKMIQDSSFDGNMRSDPHKHVANFVELCKMFRYGQGMEEGVMLSLFPSSLTGEARVWFNELEPDTIRTWEQLREAFVTRFFPPVLGRKLLNQIRGFQQWDGETLTEAWIRLKDILRNCHGHGLDKEQIIDIFYYGLDHQSQHDLDLAGGGSFLYKSTNDAHRMMEDQILAGIARDRVNKDRKVRGTVARAEGSSSDTSEIVNEIKTMSDKINTRMGRLEKDVHLVKNGCEICGGPHYSSECDQQSEDVNYAQYGYQNRGNYQNRGGNFSYGDQQNRGQRNNPPSQQRPRNEENKPKEEDDQSLKDMMKEFIHSQTARNDGMTSQMKVMNDRIEQGQRNQQAAMQDLERRFDRINERFANRPPGQLPSNTQQNPRPQNNQNNQGQKYQPPPIRDEHVNAITTRSGTKYGEIQEEEEIFAEPDSTAPHQDPLRRSVATECSPVAETHLDAAQQESMRRSEPSGPEKTDEVEIEVEDEEEREATVETNEEAPKSTTTPPIKAYKPRIPYPQRLRKEKMKEQYGKFLEMIKSVHINVPLVDLISGMPNYAKFIKELVTEKGMANYMGYHMERYQPSLEALAQQHAASSSSSATWFPYAPPPLYPQSPPQQEEAEEEESEDE